MKSTKPDMPYYHGQPIPVDGRGWLILIASVLIAFAALVAWPFRNFPSSLIPALLFVGIPLIALRWVTGSHWLALFRPLRARDFGSMVLFAFITLVGSFLMGLVLLKISPLTHNPVSETMATQSPGELLAMLLPTIPQLIGEELFGILPFLAVLWFCTNRLRLSRRAGIVIGLIVSSLIFGAAHLPTYQWNWLQSLVGIGFARVLLTMSYIVTRNLWVSAGAHILNDWTGFLTVFALGHQTMAPD